MTCSPIAGLAILAALGCGGTTTFQDTTPIRIAVAPPAPPKADDPPPAKRVEVREKHIQINEKIQFALGKSEILPASFGLLDELVKVIQENPQVQKISIEGHASDEGDEQYNLNLSKARAEAVRQYLVKNGVSAERLSSTGFGESKPLVANDTEANREKNRRVEFNITKQEPAKEHVEIDPTTGEQKVIQKSSLNQEFRQ